MSECFSAVLEYYCCVVSIGIGVLIDVATIATSVADAVVALMSTDQYSVYQSSKSSVSLDESGMYFTYPLPLSSLLTYF